MTDGIGLRGNVDGHTDEWQYRVEEIEMSWYFELAGGGSRGSKLAVSACLPSITRDHNQDLSLHIANCNIYHRWLFVSSEALGNIPLGFIILSISSQSTGKYIVILTTVISGSRALLLCSDPGQDGRDSSVIQYQRQSHFQDSYKQTKKWGTEWDGVFFAVLQQQAEKFGMIIELIPACVIWFKPYWQHRQ